MSRQVRVAVVGATGAVGLEMIDVLAGRDFPIRELKLLASARSKGKDLTFKGEKIPVEVLGPGSFEGVEIALFSAGASISKEYAPIAARAGTIVVDNSSAFRYEPEVPLVIPEINADAIAAHKGIIANPNCSTIIMLMALAPLHRAARATSVIVSTYQAVSGAGARAMAALEAEVAGREPAAGVFPHPIAFNLIPRIDVIVDDDYTKEEMKMTWESRKILSHSDLAVTATCVRVPVRRAHSESVHATFAEPLTVARARQIFEAAPGVRVLDDPRKDIYPMPLTVAGEDDVFVGRIRKSPSFPDALDFWVVGDQLRKGAALNAVQIAEDLVR
ncbi:MAG: aspartate-semialdehyde dehydrogenase [Planctomycetes bacterium]|nr:aspartate-semialdehyde dehydrogenase [Planctomycetota bacterium]